MRKIYVLLVTAALVVVSASLSSLGGISYRYIAGIFSSAFEFSLVEHKAINLAWDRVFVSCPQLKDDIINARWMCHYFECAPMEVIRTNYNRKIGGFEWRQSERYFPAKISKAHHNTHDMDFQLDLYTNYYNSAIFADPKFLPNNFGLLFTKPDPYFLENAGWVDKSCQVPPIALLEVARQYDAFDKYRLRILQSDIQDGDYSFVARIDHSDELSLERNLRMNFTTKQSDDFLTDSALYTVANQLISIQRYRHKEPLSSRIDFFPFGELDNSIGQMLTDLMRSKDRSDIPNRLRFRSTLSNKERRQHGIPVNGNITARYIDSYLHNSSIAVLFGVFVCFFATAIAVLIFVKKIKKFFVFRYACLCIFVFALVSVVLIFYRSTIFFVDSDDLSANAIWTQPAKMSLAPLGQSLIHIACSPLSPVALNVFAANKKICEGDKCFSVLDSILFDGVAKIQNDSGDFVAIMRKEGGPLAKGIYLRFQDDSRACANLFLISKLCVDGEKELQKISKSRCIPKRVPSRRK